MPALTVLVDGYNVLQGRHTESDRAALVASARTFRSAHPINQIIVVFDGVAGETAVHAGGRSGKVRVLYAAPDADTYLQEHMRRCRQPAALVVVSDDRAVRDTARACGVPRMTVSQFLGALGAPEAARSPGLVSDRPSAEAAQRITDEQRRRFGL